MGGFTGVGTLLALQPTLDPTYQRGCERGSGGPFSPSRYPRPEKRRGALGANAFVSFLPKLAPECAKGEGSLHSAIPHVA